MRYLKSIVFALLITSLVAVGLVTFGCNSDESEEQSTVEPVQQIEVRRGDLTAVISAFGNVSMPHRANLAFGVGGTVEELNVEFGDAVTKGDILAKLDVSSLTRAVERSEADLRIAQINLVKVSSDSTRLQAEAAVENAEVNLSHAEEALEQARRFNISDARISLENARRDLEIAKKNARITVTDSEDAAEEAHEAYSKFVQDNLEYLYLLSFQEQKEELRWLWEKAEKNLEIAEETAETSIATAHRRVKDAENMLANAPIDIREKEGAVATAHAALIQAKDELAYVEAGLDIELLQINVSKARIALNEAREQLQKASLAAPFDGTIANVNVIVGDNVGASTVVMQLVDISEVEVAGDVDEIDVARVEIGQKAEISIDAVPGVTFPGEVTAVTPVGSNQAGLITYGITIGIDDTLGASLKDGMTASADIHAVLAQNAILIPKSAVTRDRAAGIETVTVITDGGVEEVREIQTGVGDRSLVEITSGLKEGEYILSNTDYSVSKVAGSSSSSGSGNVDVMACVGEIMGNQELTNCFEKMMEMGEEMGMDASEFGGEIPWDEIEQYANDDTGEVPEEIKECLEIMLENRDCLDALTDMAKEMGIDPGDYNSGGFGGMGGM